MTDEQQAEENERLKKELADYHEYVERNVGKMLAALEGVAVQRFDGFCEAERDDDSLGALCLGINMMISDIGESFRELGALRDEYRESGTQLSVGVGDCLRVLRSVRAGNLSDEVSEDVLHSDNEVIATLGSVLNDTVVDLREKISTIRRQAEAIHELSTPIIPIMDNILVTPLIGTVDTRRAKEFMRALLAGITEYRAKVVIIDITGVAMVDTGVANHLNKTIHAARLKGAHAIVTGVSDLVAETITELGIDWANIETLADLQTGLLAALERTGRHLSVFKG